jgi:hypothetical protein
MLLPGISINTSVAPLEQMLMRKFSGTNWEHIGYAPRSIDPGAVSDGFKAIFNYGDNDQTDCRAAQRQHRHESPDTDHQAAVAARPPGRHRLRGGFSVHFGASLSLGGSPGGPAFAPHSTTQLPERTIRCHESCQHWRDKRRWICSRLSAFPLQDFRIGRQIPIDHCRELYGQADRLVTRSSQSLAWSCSSL